MRKVLGGLIFLTLCAVQLLQAQDIQNMGFVLSNGLEIRSFLNAEGDVLPFPANKPLCSFLIAGERFTTADAEVEQEYGEFVLKFPGSLEARVQSLGGGNPGYKVRISFTNTAFDTVVLENLVPFGEAEDHVYITGKGPWSLARAYLFRKDQEPVNVILPDNAWEMGYVSFPLDDHQLQLAAIARRIEVKGGEKKRYETHLFPGGTVVFDIYAELFSGEWQQGLRLMFQDRYLHDLRVFKEELYEREDQKWIRSQYVMLEQFAWDREWFERFRNRYEIFEKLDAYEKHLGKIDVFGIWPTWPRLGLDPRNQWDLHQDLPGGLSALRAISDSLKKRDTRFFLAYNPWDESTRQSNPYTGLAALIQATNADGVVLDTRGRSNDELQRAADSVKSGVVMYSEGMAVPQDMPGIISGRVHNAIKMAPPLNLNKLIRPDFGIFRVLDVGEDVLHREIAVAFFNGYGSELNLFRPGRGDQYEDDLDFLGRTSLLLRQNSSAFQDKDWVPLYASSGSRTWVNKWQSGGKEVYTILSLDPQGFDELLIPCEPSTEKRYISLWRHEELTPGNAPRGSLLPVQTKPYLNRYSGTRWEGSLDCVAVFPRLLQAERKGDSLFVQSDKMGVLKVWAGNPSYQTPVYSEEDRQLVVSLTKLFKTRREKLVIQLLDDGELLDELILEGPGSIPWLISRKEKSRLRTREAEGMVLIPADSIGMTLVNNDNFIPYPRWPEKVYVDSFLMDIYPVTNLEYYRFMEATDYRPIDTTNFLKHWQHGKYPQGQENYPVVYVSYEDAASFARWKGKRLPSEAEWQLAAQGTDGRQWPWGNEFHGTKCNNAFGRPTPVDAFERGASLYGVVDLVGNVWQMTHDLYFNGNYYFNIIRGGSYFNPQSSWWYIKGGPQPLQKTQLQLLVAPSYDRSETVGFRCVRDVR